MFLKPLSTAMYYLLCTAFVAFLPAELFGASAGAPPYEVLRDVGLSKTFSSEDDIAIWRSGRICINQNCKQETASRSVAIKIQAELEDRQYARIFVYDSLKSLREIIDLDEVEGDTIWTKFVAGDSMFIEVASPKPLSGSFNIESIVLNKRSGGADGIFDDSPSFDVETNSVTRETLSSTARLIVGQQEELPLKNNIPAQAVDWCSGALISDDLFLTVSHCVPRKSLSCMQTVALFGYAYNSDEPLVARRCENLVYFNSLLDIAILKLAKSDVHVKPSILSDIAPVANQALAIVEYPHGSIRLVSNDTACKVFETAVAINPSTEGLDFNSLIGLGISHGCDTLLGSSGSPVYDKEGKIIAVHQGEGAKLNVAVRIDALLQCIEIKPNGVISELQPDVPACRNESKIE